MGAHKPTDIACSAHAGPLPTRSQAVAILDLIHINRANLA